MKKTAVANDPVKTFRPNTKIRPLTPSWTSPTPTPTSVHAGLYTPIFTPGGGSGPSAAAVAGVVFGTTTMPVFGPNARTKNTI